MTKIFMNFAGMDDLKRQMGGLADQLQELEREIARVKGRLDWEVSQKLNIDDQIDSARRKAARLAVTSEQMTAVVARASTEFKRNDTKFSEKAKEQTDTLENIWRGFLGFATRTFDQIEGEGMQILNSLRSASDIFIGRITDVLSVHPNLIRDMLGCCAVGVTPLAPFVVDEGLRKKFGLLISDKLNHNTLGKNGRVVGTWNGKGLTEVSETSSQRTRRFAPEKVLSPGNFVGTQAAAMETLAEAGKEYGPRAIRDTVRPNNIGRGVWTSYIESEVATATRSFGAVAKGAKVLGYGALGLDVGYGIYENYNNGVGNMRIATDATVDTVFGLGGIGASVAAGALAGSVVPGAGTLVGAAGGLVGGVAYMFVTEVWQPGGESIKDRTKHSVYDAVR